MSTFEMGTRSVESAAPLGKNAFRFELSSEGSTPGVVQVVPQSLVNSLSGKRVTLGAWIWASQPVTVHTPQLVTGDNVTVNEVQAGTEPRFYALTTKLQRNITEIRVGLSPGLKKIDADVTVYYDGVLLLEGNHSLASQPEFDGSDGAKGRWGDGQFVNFVRNGSAEAGWPAVQAWLDGLLSANYPGSPSSALAFLLDPLAALPFYRLVLERLSESFWAGFGWGHVPLIGSWSYRLLKIGSLAGGIGAGIAIYRRRRRLRIDLALFIGLSLIAIWGSTLLRGADAMIEGASRLPVARYAYPAIIPTMLLLIFGWLGISAELRRVIKIPESVVYLLFIGFFVALDILGVISLINYYG
jgi:hypothetical protein